MLYQLFILPWTWKLTLIVLFTRKIIFKFEKLYLIEKFKRFKSFNFVTRKYIFLLTQWMMPGPEFETKGKISHHQVLLISRLDHQLPRQLQLASHRTSWCLLCFDFQSFFSRSDYYYYYLEQCFEIVVLINKE